MAYQEPGISQPELKKTDTDTKTTQMSEFCDKNFKATVTKMFPQAIINMHETNEKKENLSKEITNKIK